MFKQEAISNHLGVIMGAVLGIPYTEVNALVFSPSEYPRAFPPNPNPPTLLQQLREITLFYPANGKGFAEFDIHRLFRSLITFSDDHKRPITSENFPVSESLKYIGKVISLAQTSQRPVYLPEQLNLGLEITEGQLLPAVIICHSASRAIARNRDQRVDQRFNFPNEAITQWSQSIAYFETTTGYDPPGDTYHFWATTAMGLALRKTLGQDPITCAVYGALFYFGADIMGGARKAIARNPLHHKHREVDRIGLKIGWELGR